MVAPQVPAPPPRAGAAAAERAARKRLGAWYTPDALVDHVVGATLEGLDVRAGRRLTVVDPACGDGRFLAAAARHVEARGGTVRLVGADVDPEAVAITRRALPGAEVLHVDALRHAWAGLRADVVVGNPPFLNQMATATTRGGRSRWGGGPYADTAAEFLALSLDLVGRGGRVGLVLPQSILATRDAAPVRAGVRERAALVHAWWSTRRMFDAHVHVCALVLAVGDAQGEVTRAAGPGFEPLDPVPAEAVGGGSWSPLLLHAPPPAARPDGSTLGDIATVALDFRDQYYGLAAAVGEGGDGPPLVTSGLIEPGRCLWGERPVRFAKRRWTAPRIDLGLLSPRLRRWAAQRLVPKVLVANQTRTIEAVADPAGAWLPSVPVLTVTGHDLGRIEAVLASPAATEWVRAYAAGSGLSPGVLRLTPALLASIPLPT